MPTKIPVSDFQILFESAPGLYLVLSTDLTIVAASNSYLQATMTKRADIVGHNLFEIFPDNPNDINATGVNNLRASLKRVLLNKTTDIMSIQKYDIKRPEAEGGDFEERYWIPRNTPIMDPQNDIRYILHHVEDVTEFVKLKRIGLQQHEEFNSRLVHEEKLRQSQKMEAMGQLAGGIAHDFNNLLAIVIMNCDVALSKKTTDPSTLKCFEQIKKTGERAASLTRQLLAFSRNQVLQPRVLNLNQIISEMENILKRLINEDIELTTLLDKELGNTLVDPGQIEQIVLNLILNARDAIPSKGGKITIQTANVVLDKMLADGSPKVEPGEYILLEVKDNGIGMDAKTQARIFEPFFTTKGVGKGTGLGLATVYGIVSQNRGTIWVYSEIQKGTTFKIYFPNVKDVVEKPTLIENKFKSATGHETILVVEDQLELRMIVCETLKLYGYNVFEAENGVKALTIIREFPDIFDLIITDVIMPEMSGHSLAKKLKEMKQLTKLLYISGYSEQVLTEHGVSDEHLHFLEKPFTLDQLLQKVRTVLS